MISMAMVSQTESKWLMARSLTIPTAPHLILSGKDGFAKMRGLCGLSPPHPSWARLDVLDWRRFIGAGDLGTGHQELAIDRRLAVGAHGMRPFPRIHALRSCSQNVVTPARACDAPLPPFGE